MKKLVIFLFAISCNIYAFGQGKKYLSAMKEGIHKMEAAVDASEMLESANLFERIASAEPKEWLPAYYNAYCHMTLAAIMMQERDIEKCNDHLDKAQEALDKAREIQPQESEIIALQGYIYIGRIWEDPQVNGAEYTPVIHQTLDKAKALDPENPRAYYLKGLMVYYTPEFYGGGAGPAMPFLKKAGEKYTAFEPASGLHPDWGTEDNSRLLEAAAKKLEESKEND